MGKEVIGAQGFRLGKIEDTVFDEKSWRVTSLKVKLEKDVAEKYNLRQRFRKSHVIISVEYVSAVGDRVLLKSSNEEIMKLISGMPSPVPEQPTATPMTGESRQIDPPRNEPKTDS